MIVTKLANNRPEFRKILSKIKVNDRRIFSPDEVDYHLDCNGYEAVEFTQEQEMDDEFLKLFSTWLHERPKRVGFVDYYILVYNRKNEKLTDEQFDYMERNIAECFDSSHGWLYEINHRMRFKLRVQLFCSYKNTIRRLTRRSWRDGIIIDES